MNWNPFRRRSASPVVITPNAIPHASPIIKDVSRETWFKDPANITRLRQAFDASPILRDWLAVAWAEVPRGYPARGTTVTETAYAHELGRINGYTGCLDLLQSLMEYRKQPPVSVPMTFPKTIEETYAEHKTPKLKT